jgi:hypothetical protein
MMLPLSSYQMDALVQILVFSSVVVSYSYGQVDDFAIAAASFFSFCSLAIQGCPVNPRKQKSSFFSSESLVFFMGVFNSVSLSTQPSNRNASIWCYAAAMVIASQLTLTMRCQLGVP